MSSSYAPTHRPEQSGRALGDPVRHPSGAPSPVLTKRAFVLILMTLLVPGSAQTVAGNRRLGRVALRVTFTVWALALLAVLLLLVSRSTLINLLTGTLPSLVLVLGLGCLAIGWAALFLNTLRLIRPGMLAPRIRPAVVLALVLAMILSSGSLGYAAYLLNVSRNAIGSIFSGSGPTLEPSDGRYNFLMMGGDAGADRTGRRPDSLSVISVDAKTGSTAIISVPRNLQNAQFSAESPMRQVYPEGYNCGDECLINAINTEVTNQHQDLYPGVADPGAQATLEAVSGTLGIKVQAYVLGTWTVFPSSSTPWAASGSRPAAGSPSAGRWWMRPTASTACRTAGFRRETRRSTASTPSGTAGPGNSWTTMPASSASSACSRRC